MRKSRILFWGGLFFILGTGLAAGFKLANFYLILGFISGVVVFLVSYFIDFKSWLKILGLSLIFLVLGLWRFNVSIPQAYFGRIEFYFGQEVVFRGLITSEPDIRLKHQKLEVTAEEIVKTQERQAISGKVLVSTGLYVDYNYGDLVEVSCSLEKPEVFEGFRYDKYLARYGIYAACWADQRQIKVVKTGQGNLFLSHLLAFKQRLQTSVQQIFPEPQAALLEGLTLGYKRSIPQDLIESFRRVGLSHIIVISGLHITLLAQTLQLLSLNLYFSRQQAFWLIAIILILYLMMLGFPASATRGVIFGLILLISRQVGRLRRPHLILVFTAAVMLLINPKLLVFDPGFQLSFAATYGIMYFNPILEKVLDRLPSIFQIKEIIITSLAAMAATLPLIWYHFGYLSVVAPLANILVLPLLPFTIMAGLAVIFLGLFWIEIAQLVGLSVYFVLYYVIWLVQKLALFPHATLELGQIPWLIVPLVYLGLIFGQKMLFKRYF